ncbi:MAG: hypothetical protein CSA50_03080 [Gammaproteobacteria bacterium]|nr:MAG: hypothetical protein CSA50_03080 [Gammaproteobacteria bacterium]
MNQVQRQIRLAKIYRDLKILIIDDFENFRLALKQMLRAFGAQDIHTASNGENAIKKCETDRYDIILCDYNLGDKKNGQQILEELRFKETIKYDTIFVIVSAETAKDMVMGALEYLPDGYITKPINKDVLQKRLDLLLEQRAELADVIQALDQKNWQRVVNLCTQAIQNHSRYTTWCLRTQASAHYMLEQYEQAQKIYEEVLTKRDIGWARLGMGKVKLAQKQFDEAIDSFRSLLDKNPDEVDAHDWLASTYEQMGRFREAQQTLEKAVAISPFAILRQQKLADVCLKNNNVERATEAYRSAVKLSNNSVHDKPENYLQLGRCLSDLSEGDKTSEGKKRAKEAITTLDKANHKFKEDASVRLKSMLIESRVHLGQENAKKSQDVLAKASELMNQIEPEPEDHLEMAKTLYAQGDTAKAEKVLFSLSENHGTDRGLMKKIEDLLDEPVSLKKKLEARSLNKQGINLFENGKIKEAMAVFDKALEVTPKHPALNLNLVQVMLKDIKTQATDKSAMIEKCQACLNNVKHIPEQHRQHKRFLHLSKKVASLVN